MKERPIIFNAAMVRAILSGQKTQTRRVVKPQPASDERLDVLALRDSVPYMWIPRELGATALRANAAALTCPFGLPGERLWLRESFRFEESLDRLSPRATAESCVAAGYRAPWAPTLFEADGTRTDTWLEGFFQPPDRTKPGKLRPAIHMPRWASRITLEVVSVRIERLNGISEADAIAEGVSKDSDGWTDYLVPSTQACVSAKASFGTLWESINGAGSWPANPWVWVVEFKAAQVKS